MRLFIAVIICFISIRAGSQDLSSGYLANDLTLHPMQPLNKPAYLDTISDGAFPNTSLRRITDAGNGNRIAPMYNTIQAWNADESLMIVYAAGVHQLLHGTNYAFIRNLSDIAPDDIETIFWHFSDPQILFYLEASTFDFISYNVNTQVKTTIVNLATVSACADGIGLGNDIQMMSWDSDVICFRCNNTSAYYYRISTSSLTEFNIVDLNYTAPMPFPSGSLFYHMGKVYDTNGQFVRSFNLDNVEHSCLGRLSNGDDAYFAIAFEEGPNGGCQGNLVAHNATNGNCFSVTTAADYGYPQTGTHISALAHTNTEGGWVAVSMIGYDEDGQGLCDQEIFIAKVNEFNSDVYRVAHHRSDENEFDYFGEPHVTISPSGTRLLFGSDWSGAEDGQSVDCYVAELFAHHNGGTTDAHIYTSPMDISIYPNPFTEKVVIDGAFDNYDIEVRDVMGDLIDDYSSSSNPITIDLGALTGGMYFLYVANTVHTAASIVLMIKQ